LDEMTARRVLLGLLVGALLLAGTAGLSSLQDDDWCGTGELGAGERANYQSTISLWPPGSACVYTLADGTTLTEEPSAAGFLGGLAGALLVVYAGARHWPRVPSHVRLAATATVALAVMGLGGLIGGYQFAASFGFLFGAPTALVTERLLPGHASEGSPRHAGALGVLVGTGAVFLGGLLWLLGLGIAAFALAVALIAVAGYAAERRRARTRLLGDAPA
jgi:hypothetical protein